MPSYYAFVERFSPLDVYFAALGWQATHRIDRRLARRKQPLANLVQREGRLPVLALDRPSFHFPLQRSYVPKKRLIHANNFCVRNGRRYSQD